MNLDDLSKLDGQLHLSLAAWGYYYEDYIKLSTGIKILQASRGRRDHDYEIQLVHSLADRHLNEKWSFGETGHFLALNGFIWLAYSQLQSVKRDLGIRCKHKRVLTAVTNHLNVAQVL